MRVAIIPPLEQDGLPHLAQPLQQGEVLHVPGSDLEDIGVFVHQIDVFRIDNLGNDLQAGSLPSLRQQLQSFLFQALKIVGRGPRLVGPAAQNLGAGRLDAIGRRHELFPVLDRAGTGHDHELVSSDTETVHPDTVRSCFNSLPTSLKGCRMGMTDSTPGTDSMTRD